MEKQVTITLTQEQMFILNMALVYAHQKMVSEVGYYATELQPFTEVKNEIKKQYKAQ
jgi:hypothetical protein